MKLLVIATVCLLSVSRAYAQNPCTAVKPPVTVISAASTVTATAADFNQTFNGAPVITDFDVSVFQPGADPLTATPVLTRNILKALWTLVAGTADCYQTPAAFLMTVTPNTTFDMWVRSNGPGGKGAWVGGSGAVPFGFPSAPGARTGVRATP